jgi:hypothetical protein
MYASLFPVEATVQIECDIKLFKVVTYSFIFFIFSEEELGILILLVMIKFGNIVYSLLFYTV